MRLLRCAAVLVGLPLIGLAGCDDPLDGFFDPIPVTDTVALAAPAGLNDTLPTALDLTVASAGPSAFVRGGRFPERTEDATQWDMAIRLVGGELVFLPAGAAGLAAPELERAGITQPITDRSFDSIEEAPSGTELVSDSTVVIREGAAYAARSRSAAVCGGGVQYAKILPIAVNPDSGTVSLHVTTNAQCNDRRLVEN